ncbi:hypothetical protein RRG08_040910 [Elysia crispata]|uniref:Uncharacterized protein n=1 Tax=Elysia crispata TaxID=231223 RepID=A0AAE0ZS11_9GAST|nr:hypothetical protein RRG08_040910 [Elysia crispata]
MANWCSIQSQLKTFDEPVLVISSGDVLGTELRCLCLAVWSAENQFGNLHNLGHYLQPTLSVARDPRVQIWKQELAIFTQLGKTRKMLDTREGWTLCLNQPHRQWRIGLSIQRERVVTAYVISSKPCTVCSGHLKSELPPSSASKVSPRPSERSGEVREGRGNDDEKHVMLIWENETKNIQEEFQRQQRFPVCTVWSQWSRSGVTVNGFSLLIFNAVWSRVDQVGANEAPPASCDGQAQDTIVVLSVHYHPPICSSTEASVDTMMGEAVITYTRHHQCPSQTYNKPTATSAPPKLITNPQPPEPLPTYNKPRATVPLANLQQTQSHQCPSQTFNKFRATSAPPKLITNPQPPVPIPNLLKTHSHKGPSQLITNPEPQCPSQTYNKPRATTTSAPHKLIINPEPPVPLPKLQQSHSHQCPSQTYNKATATNAPPKLTINTQPPVPVPNLQQTHSHQCPFQTYNKPTATSAPHKLTTNPQPPVPLTNLQQTHSHQCPFQTYNKPRATSAPP